MVVRFSSAFKKQLRRLARKYRRVRADLDPLITQLEAGETPGEQVQGIGCTVYKARVRNTDTQRGTSGGYRVIYYLATAADVLIVAIYSKTEQDDIDNDVIVRVIRDDETP